MKTQRGIGVVSGFLLIVLLVVVAMIAVKVIPIWVEYFSLRKVIADMVASGDLNAQTPLAVRQAFDRRADTGYVQSVAAKDLEIRREENQFVVYYQYQAVVPLVGNASLVFDFAGSSKDTRLLPRSRLNE